tara:strand:- start:2279 stop:3775 length:1497 start_codon:yes stop_codon:yes gene_type:complete
MNMPKDILLMKEISKTFPGVKALDNVSFEIKSGEVHSLIGQNGAGKSTLMGILNGITKPDIGEIFINDQKVKIDDPNDAFNLNLSIVHQEFALCNNLTVSQNISLGNETYNKIGIINKKLIDDKAMEVLKSINVNLDINEIVGNLNTSQWQIIEICKALVKNPKYIVMDEPTASLDENQIENLFSIIERLKNNGIGIIYISHKLNEIIKISDRITVLKDGKISKVFDNENLDESKLIKSMVGDAVEIKKEKKVVKEKNPKILELNNFTYQNKFTNINLELRNGEVLGLSGLLGSGTNEILRGLFGILNNKEGEIFLNNKKIEVNSPIDAVNYGFGYIPSDRKNEGLIQENSIKENSVLTIFKNLTKFGLFNSTKAENVTNEYIEKLQVKISNINDKVMNLSGGNQQKIVIAKWLAKNCKILLFDEPTRGIDVGAKAQIWKLINDFSKSGGAVLVASNEIPELISGCDRILTMNKGKIIKIFEENQFNEEEISMCISTS